MCVPFMLFCFMVALYEGRKQRIYHGEIDPPESMNIKNAP